MHLKTCIYETLFIRNYRVLKIKLKSVQLNDLNELLNVERQISSENVFFFVHSFEKQLIFNSVCEKYDIG